MRNSHIYNWRNITVSNLIKIGFASIDTHVGNFTQNSEKVLAMAIKMAKENCTIAVFQEQVFSGYPSEDLVLFPLFVEEQLKAFQQFATATHQINGAFDPVFVVGVTIPHRGQVFNCAACIYKGEILGFVPKEKLPNDGIFHEVRTFSPGIAGYYQLIQPFQNSPLQKEIPFGDLVFDFPFGSLSIEVCEDIWSSNGPMSRRGFESDIVANISASPFRAGVLNTRREMIATRASDNNVVLVYTNQFGGQDADAFDGGGFIYQNGRLIIEGKRWCEGFSASVVDLNTTKRNKGERTTWRRDWVNFVTSSIPKPRHVKVDYWDSAAVSMLPAPQSNAGNPFIPSEMAAVPPHIEYYNDVLMAMQTGLAGYFEKSGAFERIGIALSGGNDSYLTLLVSWLFAKDYVKRKYAELSEWEQEEKIKDFIHCFSMPTRYNSDDTKNIAKLAAKEMRVTFVEESIEDAFNLELAVQEKLKGEALSSLAKQNIQPRIRGMRMWNWTSEAKALFLHTGNMSENAVGYTTIGGDMEGGYSLIGNLPKSVILRLLKHLHSSGYEFESLQKLLETQASAELEPNQEDEKDLMPFDVLDTLLDLLIGEKKGPYDMYVSVRSKYSDDELSKLAPWYKKGDLKAWTKRFVTLYFRSTFKRVQMPQAVHQGRIDLDRERSLHLPVVMSPDWYKEDFAKIDAAPD